MGFYRRYGGVVPPEVRSVDRNPGLVEGRTPVGKITSASTPIFPPTPVGIETFKPSEPRRGLLPFLTEDPQQRAVFGPTQSMTPVSPAWAPLDQVASVVAAAQKAAESNDRAAVTSQVAARKVVEAGAAAHEATQTAARASVLPLPDVEADALAAKLRASQAAADAMRAADAAAKADVRAQQDAEDHQLVQEKVAQAAVAASDRSIEPGPLVAWDQRDPAEAIPVVAEDGTTVAMMQAKTPMLAIAAAAGGGFLVGGPIGALIGAGIGYFVAKRSG